MSAIPRSLLLNLACTWTLIRHFLTRHGMDDVSQYTGTGSPQIYLTTRTLILASLSHAALVEPIRALLSIARTLSSLDTHPPAAGRTALRLAPLRRGSGESVQGAVRCPPAIHLVFHVSLSSYRTNNGLSSAFQTLTRATRVRVWVCVSTVVSLCLYRVRVSELSDDTQSGPQPHCINQPSSTGHCQTDLQSHRCITATLQCFISRAQSQRTRSCI